MVALVRRRRVRGACKERNQSNDSMHPLGPAAGRRSVHYLRGPIRRTRHLCEGVLMSNQGVGGPASSEKAAKRRTDLNWTVGPTLMNQGVLDERKTWIRHSYYLALLTAGFHFLQFAASA